MKLLKPINYRNIKNINLDDFHKKMEQLGVDKSFVVAASGGPDSLALMFLAKEYALKKNIKFFIFCFNHGLRKESEDEVKWLKKIAKKENINFATKTVRKKIDGSDILSQARKVRYQEIVNFCNTKKIKYLLTAHHLDDEIENFLMRLIRGSGLRGLSSLKEKSRFKDSNIFIIRPLLSYPKKMLIKYLAKIKQNYVYDITNKNILFDRSRIRKLSNELINEGLDKKRLSSVFKNLKSAENAINVSVDKFLIKNIIKKNNNSISINKKKLMIQPKEIQHRVIIKLCRLIGMNDKNPRSSSVIRLINNFQEKKCTKLTLNGCIFQAQKNNILISTEKRSRAKSKLDLAKLFNNKEWPELIRHF